MAVRDLLWGCPMCQTAGTIRPAGRRERCRACRATFRRGAGVVIIAEHDGRRIEHSAPEWLAILGPVQAPEAGDDGIVLGPERVRVKLTTGQKPVHFGGELIGWVEEYGPPQAGTMTLRAEDLLFQPDDAAAIQWRPAELTGLQPASSSLQLGLHQRMASVKFLEGSVRLWTRAISELLRGHHRALGRDVLEFQPFVRTCAITRSTS